MKKGLLSLAFVLAISSSAVNASSSDEIVSTISTENIEIVEYRGCASDCVRWARGLVMEIADRNDENPNDYRFYMDIYMRYYTGCQRGC